MSPGHTAVSSPDGARVPGTDYLLDPVQAACTLGAMIRWLDYNDTWLAAEWGHPSDTLGGILALADYLSRRHAQPDGAGRPRLVRHPPHAPPQPPDVPATIAPANPGHPGPSDRELEATGRISRPRKGERRPQQAIRR